MKQNRRQVILQWATAVVLASSCLWATPPTVPDNQWTLLPTPAGVPIQILGWESSVYASSIDRTIFWGAYHIQSSETQNAVLAYSFTDNRWDILDLTKQYHTEFLPTEGHDFGGPQYNSVEDFWLFPFVKSMAPGQNFTYIFDFKAMAARRMQPRTQVYLWANKAGAFDPVNNKSVIFGGDVWGSGSGTTWQYTYSTNSWQNMLPSVHPSDRSSSAMAYDSARRVIVLYGGTNGGSETWWYSVDSNKWTLKTPAGDSPGAQREHSMVYMNATGKILLMGSISGTVGTWIYDAGANTWTAVAGANTPSSRFWTLSYDTKNNVCLWIQYGGGGPTGGWGYGHAMYAFRYAPAGTPKMAAASKAAPALSKALAAQAGAGPSLNADTTGWAFNPHMVSDGTNLYVGWGEFSVPNSAVPRSWHIKKWDGVNWTEMGTHTPVREEMAPYLAVSQSKVLHMVYPARPMWTGDSLRVMKWQGSAWSLVGNAPAFVSATNGERINNYKIALKGETPYVAWTDLDFATASPPRHSLRVVHFDGSAWKFDSLPMRRYLNRFTGNGTQSQSEDIAVAPGGTVYLAWDEFIETGTSCTPSWVFVMKLAGDTAWEKVGGALNTDSLNNWATCPSLAFSNDTPIVAYDERTVAGLNQIRVKKWNGSSWAPMGGSANVNGDSGHAYHPYLKNIGPDLFLTFCEFRKGDRVKTYLKKWDGGHWVSVGGSYNADPVNGSAADASVDAIGNKLYLAWSENSFPGFRQVRTAEVDTLITDADSKTRAPAGAKLSSSPNPFNPESRIAVDLPGAAFLNLGVYDVNGKLVKRIAAKALQAGKYYFAWDATDRNGAKVAAGIYIYKMVSDRRVLLAKTLLVK